ncbi:hypothetical protein C8034_v011812 [Colletotrichum sidae]|uniref:Uncharacterized protein n=1 Tax=Colletotrichum sidae TaxID=1347389 RepID=A0A4R8THK1_9PEZI|nr:hypothetical protein C8034_v011812 [Colletotrichum sidae]
MPRIVNPDIRQSPNGFCTPLPEPMFLQSCTDKFAVCGHGCPSEPISRTASGGAFAAEEVREDTDIGLIHIRPVLGTNNEVDDFIVDKQYCKKSTYIGE